MRPLSSTRHTVDPATDHESARVLEFSHVTKRYGPSTVVDDLTFSVRPGRVTGFLGPNGSGKSTTMKILLGLVAPDQGGDTIGGKRYRDLVEPSRLVGAALETNSFHPGRSGRNHLRVLADAAGVSASRVDETLELVGLSDAAGRRAGTYSLGMRQRLGLAGALLTDPSILVLDEPANGLDPQGIRQLRELLRGRAAQGHTVLVSSHLLGEVEHLADDVVVINRGRLVVAGALHDLERRAALVRSPDAPELERALAVLHADVDRRDGRTLVVRGADLDQIGSLAARFGIVLHELSPQAGSLEELFMEWTASPAGAVDQEATTS